jgi:integrase/recombinase XerD
MNKQEEFAFLLSGFLADYLTVQKNFSSNTVSSYRDTFVLMFQFMQTENMIPPEKLSIDDFNTACIQDFLSWLENARKCSISTRNQRLAVLHSFFRYVMFKHPEHIHKCQQILGTCYKKVPMETIHYLSEDQTRMLLAQPDTTRNVGLRDAAMLSLLYDSAARVQEFIDLNVSNIRLEKPAVLTLTGKGRKTRQIPVMEDTAHLMRQYLKRIPYQYCGTAQSLFTSHTGGRFTRPGITHVIKKYCFQAFGSEGIGFPVTPHILRHSKGLHMLHAGVNVYYIKEFLGHSNLSTTERYYVRADTEMKRKALEKVTADIIPDSNIKQPVWKKDADLLAWLKSLS